MNKKIFCFLLFSFILISSSFSETDEDYENRLPEKYEEDEFHPILRDLRRAEVILIGSYPLAVLVSMISLDLYDYAASGFDSALAPFSGQGSARTVDDTKRILLTALCISAAVTITDFIIGKVKAKKANEKKHKNYSRPPTEESPSR